MPAPKGLGALALVDAAAAGRKLRAAIRLHRGDLDAAARELGIHWVTLREWLNKFPGGKGHDTCRAWVDATFPQSSGGRRKKIVAAP